MIPKILHFVWVGDEAQRPDQFLATWVKNNPSWTIKVWGNDDLTSRQWRNDRQIRELARFDARGVAALMRWEILLEEGGLVFDIDSSCVRPLDDALLECEAFACWENELAEPGLISAAFVGSVPGNPFIETLVARIGRDPELDRKSLREALGSGCLTRVWRDERYAGLTVYPSHYFNPRHPGGTAYQGSGCVYAVHAWATTRGQAKNIRAIEAESGPLGGPAAGTSKAATAPRRPAPKFSIVIPTYNRVDLLKLAVESALAQTYPDFEVLIVDDGSTDATDAYLAAIADSRVRSVRQANGGEAAARNRGIAEAHGDYIVWLDSDDLLLPDALARYAARIDAGSATDVMYGFLIFIDESGRETQRSQCEDLAAMPVFPNLFFRNRLPNPGTAVRRALYAKAGPYDTSFTHCTDYEFWQRAAAAGATFSCLNDFICRYRWYPGNASSNHEKMRQGEAKVAEKGLREIPLQTLFPNLDWHQPDMTRVRALLLGALVLVERGALEACAETAMLAQQAAAAVRHASSVMPSPRITAANETRQVVKSSG